MQKLCFAFLVISISFLIIFSLKCNDPSVETVYPLSSSSAVLVIDAGHGGEDGGASSVTGALESHINLAVARRLELVLGLFGVHMLPLRESDISLHDPQAKTLRQKKVSDLNNRVKTVQSQENPVLLSIHQNSYPDSRYSGAQVFYAPTQGSRELAQIIQESLRLTLDPTNTRQEKQIPDTIFLMNHISCPGVLVECGFLTNPREDRLLCDHIYQTKLAVALAGGYLRSVRT
ncbi:MAG: N-acetylmuramoyl-L-alanine amidase [Ruminococcaceae bacterium]|nr:N-acetylmuramoyl-L-alanine amidase [Oscillospiraceae bacterium]